MGYHDFLVKHCNAEFGVHFEALLIRLRNSLFCDDGSQSDHDGYVVSPPPPTYKPTTTKPTTKYTTKKTTTKKPYTTKKTTTKKPYTTKKTTKATTTKAAYTTKKN